MIFLSLTETSNGLSTNVFFFLKHLKKTSLKNTSLDPLNFDNFKTTSLDLLNLDECKTFPKNNRFSKHVKASMSRLAKHFHQKLIKPA